MKRYRLEGEPQEAEMVECKSGEYVKIDDVAHMMNPRTWNEEQHDAWHKNLPNVKNALGALMQATLSI